MTGFNQRIGNRRMVMLRRITTRSIDEGGGMFQTDNFRHTTLAAQAIEVLEKLGLFLFDKLSHFNQSNDIG